MLGTTKLFFWKLKNRFFHLIRFNEIWNHSINQKMSCAKCGCHIYYDFSVSDKNWNELTKKWINTALCINCFKELTDPNLEFFIK